jgi:hypothetical protein
LREFAGIAFKDIIGLISEESLPKVSPVYPRGGGRWGNIFKNNNLKNI